MARQAELKEKERMRLVSANRQRALQEAAIAGRDALPRPSSAPGIASATPVPSCSSSRASLPAKRKRGRALFRALLKEAAESSSE